MLRSVLFPGALSVECSAASGPQASGGSPVATYAQRLRKADPVKNADIYAEHERADWSVKGVLHRTLYRPIQMLFVEPILLLVTIYLSLVYGVLYARTSPSPPCPSPSH